MTAAAETDWGALMAAAQDGHGGAYSRLLTELREWLLRYYSRRLPPSQIEDIVQDTLIAVHEKRHTYDRSRPFKPWIAAVARYKWIDRLRSMSRSRTEPLDDNDASIGDHESTVIGLTVLNQLMATLKPAQSTVIRLVKIDGYSIEEASERTGQSSALVKVNIHRGVAKLASLIQRQSHAE